MIKIQCKSCWTHFKVTTEDFNFYKKVSPQIDEQILEIPAPTLCPVCREQRRFAFRNERNLYKRKCDATGKYIISMFSPDKPYKVYKYEFWWSDQWDAMEYGRDFDFSKPFFEQFDDLLKAVPWPNLIWMQNINSPYINFAVENKSCYMIFASSRNEDSLYSRWIFDSKDLVDSDEAYKSENSYYLIRCQNVYKCHYCIDCIDCNNCEYCYDLQWCSNCFGCYNLRNKQYCIFNQQYTKEEYFEKLNQLKSNPNLLEEIYQKAIHKNLRLINVENVLWDNVSNARNCQYVFNAENLENCKYVYNAYDMKDSYDIAFQAYNTFLLYEIISTEKSNKSAFNFILINSSNCYYNMLTFNSRHTFGCVGVKNKEYCILNKAYTKHKYEKLVKKIINHMKETGERGEFFDPKISPFGYNETLANEFYPLDRTTALEKGFKWSNYEKPTPKVEKVLKADELPQKYRRNRWKYFKLCYRMWGIQKTI